MLYDLEYKISWKSIINGGGSQGASTQVKSSLSSQSDPTTKIF